MQNIIEYIQKKLFENQDLGYRDFHSRLMPTIDKETVIGVRTPVLRKLAKELKKELGEENLKVFLNTLPHDYYEENNLHGFFIEMIKDADECLLAIDRFLPYVDNWATCDLLSPRVLKKNKDKVFDKVVVWIEDDYTYKKRFAIGCLMNYFLDEDFDMKYIDMAVRVRSEEYYVNMMIAWYIATALAKQYEAVIPVIEQKRLPDWVHRKSIQKAIESNRIDKETKDYLRTLK